MLLTRDTLPQTIADIAALDDLLCRPSQALIDDLRKVDGDIMILGVAGKMGPTLAGLAKAAAPERRVIGVARFSDPAVKDWLQARGVETINCDLLDEAAIKALPKAPNIIFMAGRKFGAEGDLSLTWAMNAHVPALVAQALPRRGSSRSRPAASIRSCPWTAKARTRTWRPTRPANTHNPASAASACSNISRGSIRRPAGCSGSTTRSTCATACCTTSPARSCRASRSTSASAMSTSSGRATPPRRRCAAWRIATRRPRRSMSAATRFSPCAISPQNSASGSAARPCIVGKEQPTAWLTDTSQAAKLFGLPIVDTEQLIAWTADWVSRSMPSLGKPTKYEVRDGRY